jgi:uncharacterized protein YceK
MAKRLLCLLVLLLASGCAGVAGTYDPASPASHHAQRKYLEAKKNSPAVPAEKQNGAKGRS